jgi:hypothetical protein
MKNKIKTALAGSLFGLGLASASVAQTTVSGNLDLAYHAVSSNAVGSSTLGGGSYRAVGRETQINLANKGKLSNGMDYAAGFSLEYDGPDAGATGMYAEGNYIEIISGNTKWMVGADRIQNGDRHVTNANGIGYIGQDGMGTGVANTSTGAISIMPRHGSIYQFFGTGITQKVGNGGLSFYYVPNMTTTVLNEIGNDAGTQAQLNDSYATSKGSGYEIGYLGDLGVKGLTAQAFFTRGEKVNDQQELDKKAKSDNFGLSYNTGPVTLSASQLKTKGVQNGFAAAGGATAGLNGNLGEELKGRSVGVA